MVIIKKLAGTLSSLLLIIAVALALFMIWQKLTPGPPRYQAMVVYSGSMSPAIAVGDLILLRAGAPSEIKKGDIITFKQPSRSKSPASKDNSVTHRVVKVLGGSAGPAFRTKGDGNKKADPLPVESNRVLGKVFLHIPRAGYLVSFIHRPLGFGLLIILPVLLILAGEIRNIIRRGKGVEHASPESE